MTVDSHRQFPKLTNSQNLTTAVNEGKDVWHKYNCVNCHTLFGGGAYHAPDLTKITQLSGEASLTAYMKDPSQFYDEQKPRHLRPKQNLSDVEIRNLLQFLDWVSKVGNQGWPPRPILVTGSTIPGSDMASPWAAPASLADRAARLDEAPGSGMRGPGVAGPAAHPACGPRPACRQQ